MIKKKAKHKINTADLKISKAGKYKLQSNCYHSGFKIIISYLSYMCLYVPTVNKSI